MHCGLCEPECPVNAIYAEDEVPADEIEFIKINEKYSKIWPNISEKRCFQMLKLGTI